MDISLPLPIAGLAPAVQPTGSTPAFAALLATVMEAAPSAEAAPVEGAVPGGAAVPALPVEPELSTVPQVGARKAPRAEAVSVDGTVLDEAVVRIVPELVAVPVLPPALPAAPPASAPIPMGAEQGPATDILSKLSTSTEGGGAPARRSDTALPDPARVTAEGGRPTSGDVPMAAKQLTELTGTAAPEWGRLGPDAAGEQVEPAAKGGAEPAGAAAAKTAAAQAVSTALQPAAAEAMPAHLPQTETEATPAAQPHERPARTEPVPAEGAGAQGRAVGAEAGQPDARITTQFRSTEAGPGREGTVEAAASLSAETRVAQEAAPVAAEPVLAMPLASGRPGSDLQAAPALLTEAQPRLAAEAMTPPAPSAAPPSPDAPAPPPRPAAPIPWPVRQLAPFAVALALGPDARVTLTLEPAELGQVEVSIERSGDAAAVRVVAERPETLALLQRDGRELERALQAAGLGEREASLSFSLGGDTPREAPDRGAPHQPRGGVRVPAPDALPHPSPTLARRGLIDLAV